MTQLQQNNLKLRDRTANQITQYHNQLAHLQAQLSQTNQAIAGIKISKFWKIIPRAWFRLKKGKAEK